MKKINTKPFGEIEVDPSQELTFQNGLFGFENNKKFYLLENPKSPFVWLQSSEDPSLAFIMIHPLQFKADYQLNIAKNDLKDIGIEEKNKTKELLDFVIVTIPENPSEMTANLQGPVIININKKLGKQAITLNENHPVKCLMLDEMKDSFNEKITKTKKEIKNEKEEKGKS